MKPIILSTSFVRDEAAMKLVLLWADTIIALNPETDVVLFDGGSPYPVETALESRGFIGVTAPIGQCGIPDIGRRVIVRAETDMGKSGPGGYDYTSSTLFGAVESAADRGYTHAIYIESDLIFARPASYIAERMGRFGMRVAAPYSDMHAFIETGLMGFDTAFARDRGLAKSWRNRELRGGEWPEMWVERFYGDDLHALLLRGMRDDLHRLDRQNAMYVFPRGWDYLTHCADLAVYRELLERNGVKV